MKFDIVTLFPDYFAIPLRQSLVGKGLDKKLFDIEITNLRDFATDRHKTVDDRPFGGSGGMVLKLEPLDACLKSLGHAHRDDQSDGDRSKIILTSAAGRPFDQATAKRLSLTERMTIVCGHYLGVDERIRQLYEIEEISIGDYILTGGEPAALVMIDAIVRLIPGVLGNFESALNDSHMENLLGTPHYTRPAEYDGLKVPAPLLSGDHAAIEKFRRYEAIRRCYRHRPELLESEELSPDERAWLDELKNK
jgi:tRNA (guanine37-N1)-methyltransferase